MVPTYHIRIKKDYAASVIEDLRKMDAIEFIDDSESREIPSWQREEVNQRIKKYKIARRTYWMKLLSLKYWMQNNVIIYPQIYTRGTDRHCCHYQNPDTFWKDYNEKVTRQSQSSGGFARSRIWLVFR